MSASMRGQRRYPHIERTKVGANRATTSILIRVIGHQVVLAEIPLARFAFTGHLNAIISPDLECYLVAGEKDQPQDVSAGSIKCYRD